MSLTLHLWVYKLVLTIHHCLVIGGLFLSQMMKPVMGGDAEAWERKLAAKVGPFVSFLYKILYFNAGKILFRMECTISSPCLTTMRRSWMPLEFPRLLCSLFSEARRPWKWRSWRTAQSRAKQLQVTEKHRSALSLFHSLDFVTQDHYYEFDKEWEMEYGKGMGVMHVVCTREKPHILMCRYIVSWLNVSMIQWSLTTRRSILGSILLKE